MTWNKGQMSTPENPGSSKLMRWINQHMDSRADECLLWPFGVGHNGYALYGRGGKGLYVHRFMCERRNGPPPTPKYHAAHSCGTPHCCNPMHVSWKTNAENQDDAVRQGMHKNGHRWKLTPEQALEIRSAPQRRGIAKELATHFKVSHTTIRQIRTGKIWYDGSFSFTERARRFARAA